MTKSYRLSDMTQATIKATREQGIAQCEACIAEAESGAVFVNDLPGYIAYQRGDQEKYRNGDYDHTLHFLQRAIYIQTGESIPMMSK